MLHGLAQGKRPGVEKLKRVKGDRSPLREVWGQWPGNESIDQILSMLTETSAETERVGQHVGIGNAPRQAILQVTSESPPDFEYVELNGPVLNDGVALQRYRLLRHGVSMPAVVEVKGSTAAEFAEDKDKVFEGAKAEVISQEADLVKTKAITG